MARHHGPDFMLAFVISLDDVVITEFVKSAGQDTLPTYMLGQLRRGSRLRGQRDFDRVLLAFGAVRHLVLLPQPEENRAIKWRANHQPRSSQ